MVKKTKIILLSILAIFIGMFFNHFTYYFLLEKSDGIYKLINCLEKVTSSPYLFFSIQTYPLLLFLLGLFIGGLILILSLGTGKYRQGKEYGSATWATKGQLKPFQAKPPKIKKGETPPEEDMNIILSKDIKMSLPTHSMPFKYQRNKNILLIAGAGAGKTEMFVKPNLSQLHSSYVVTDPKGKLLHETGKMMSEHGYTIKCFNVNDFSNSNKFNPFKYIRDEVTLKRVIQCIIDATNGENSKKGEPFWDKSEELLLSSLFSMLYYNYKDEVERNPDKEIELPKLYEVSDLIRLLNRTDEETPSPLELAFEGFEEDFGSDNYAVTQFNSFKNYKGKTRSSVLAIATARFSMFDLKDIREVLDDDELDIDSWIDKKTIVYLPIPDMDTTFNFLTTMIFVLAFRTLEYKIDNIPPKNEYLHVRFILDEFANLGKIPNIKEALAVFRSREMSINIILQNLNQLRALYKDDWQSFVGNCDTIMYLSGSTEPETEKFFSERAGKETINMRKQTENRGGQGSYSINHDVLGRDLITKDEVNRLPRDECLISISSMPMYKGKKFKFNGHKRSSEWSRSSNDENWFDFKPVHKKKIVNVVEEETLKDDEYVENIYSQFND